jgi:hypothetical protein
MISRDFLFGGHAIFTVSNPTGTHFTYRISAPDDQHEDNPLWFLSVLTGPDNTRDYSYAGIVRKGGTVHLTAKSRFKADALSINVAKWAILLICNGDKLPEGYKIQHEGKCGVCGRPLTTPESVESGIGPVCAGRLL